MPNNCLYLDNSLIIYSTHLRSGSMHWGCEVIVPWWSLRLLGVPRWHCRCCCPHCRRLCFWCMICLPCSLAGRMPTCGLCNIYVYIFDWIFSDISIGKSFLIVLLTLSVPSFTKLLYAMSNMVCCLFQGCCIVCWDMMHFCCANICWIPFFLRVLTVLRFFHCSIRLRRGAKYTLLFYYPNYEIWKIEKKLANNPFKGQYQMLL